MTHRNHTVFEYINTEDPLGVYMIRWLYAQVSATSAAAAVILAIVVMAYGASIAKEKDFGLRLKGFGACVCLILKVLIWL